MSGGGRPQEDPMLRLQYYRETGQADQAKLYEQYLRETNQLKGGDIHAQFRSGALQKRMEGANRRDALNQRELEAVPQGPREAFGGVLGSLLNHVPGGKAFTAASRSAIYGKPYGESYSDVEQAIDRTPAAVRVPMDLAGAGLSIGAMPGSSTAARMGQGGVLHALLSGDPNQDIDARAGRAVVEGGLGYGLGAAGSKVGSITGGSGRIGKMVRAVKQPVANLKNAFRRGQVGGMDIEPPTPPRPQAPRPPSAPLSQDVPESPTAAGLRRSGVPKMDVAPETPPTRPQGSRHPSTSPNWDQKLSTRLQQWAGEPRPPSTRPDLSAMEILPEPPAAAAEATATSRPQAHVAPQAAPAKHPIDDLLDRLLGKMRQEQPAEIGNVVGDAELASRPHATDDLEDLLRRSLAMKRTPK